MKPKIYVCYEEDVPFKEGTERDWANFYDEFITKGEAGWDTFEDWWHDMTKKDGLIMEQEQKQEYLEK